MFALSYSNPQMLQNKKVLKEVPNMHSIEYL